MKKINNRIVGEVKSKPTKLYWSGRHVHGIECLCKECNKAIPTKDNCNCTESRKMPINGKLMCMDCNREVKDNWIKAFDEKFPGDLATMEEDGIHAWITSSRYNRDSLKAFISQVEKDAIEKTNKGWREKLEEYIDKLDKWTPPSQFGSASGSMTKKFIKDDLSDLLEDK